MERREAQHPYVTGVRAPRGRTRNPVLERTARGRPDRKGPAHEGPRKPLAPPGAPFPFWGDGKRDTGLPGAVNNAGDEAWLRGFCDQKTTLRTKTSATS
jgi:hypothetical protein